MYFLIGLIFHSLIIFWCCLFSSPRPIPLSYVCCTHWSSVSGISNFFNAGVLCTDTHTNLQQTNLLVHLTKKLLYNLRKQVLMHVFDIEHIRAFKVQNKKRVNQNRLIPARDRQCLHLLKSSEAFQSLHSSCTPSHTLMFMCKVWGHLLICHFDEGY